MLQLLNKPPRNMHKRSPKFVPQIISHLARHSNFTCKLSDLPASYQDQPYNLAAKVLSRGGVTCKVVINRAKDTFVILRS